jgi:hypothetical protein
MVLDEPPPIDGIRFFLTAEFLRVVRPSLVARVSACSRGAAQFSTAAIFCDRFIDSRGKLIATRSTLQLILLLIRESGAAGSARQRRFLFGRHAI